MHIFHKILLLFCVFLNSFILLSQEQIDSLENKTYLELADMFFDETDSKNMDIATKCAEYFLEKAKKEDYLERIAQGFNFLAYINEDDKKLDYLDSIILYTKDSNLKKYPLDTYITKSDYYYDNRDFKKALDNSLLANAYVDNSNDIYLKIRVHFSVGLIKTRLGYYNDALQIFKKSAADYKKIKDDDNYLITLFAVADAYRHLKLLDSASFYNQKGLKMALVKENEKRYNYFLLNEGINQYDKNNYKKSLNYIRRAIPYLERIQDKPNIAMGYHFIGKVHKKFGDMKKTELYLKKVDTIYEQISDLHPELRHGYEILIDIYKKSGDIEQQLVYIEKLLKIDSILKSNYEYLTKKLTVEYDTPNLLREKEELIVSLQERKKKVFTKLFLFC